MKKPPSLRPTSWEISRCPPHAPVALETRISTSNQLMHKLWEFSMNRWGSQGLRSWCFRNPSWGKGTVVGSFSPLKKSGQNTSPGGWFFGISELHQQSQGQDKQNTMTLGCWKQHWGYKLARHGSTEKAWFFTARKKRIKKATEQ